MKWDEEQLQLVSLQNMGIIFYLKDVATWEVSWKIWINKWQVGQGGVGAMACYLTWWNESLSGIQRPRYLQDQGFPAGPVLVSYLGALSWINLKTWDCGMGQDSDHSICFLTFFFAWIHFMYIWYVCNTRIFSYHFIPSLIFFMPKVLSTNVASLMSGSFNMTKLVNNAAIRTCKKSDETVKIPSKGGYIIPFMKDL